MSLSSEAIQGQLATLLARPEWVQSARMSQFLRFVVERSLAGEGGSLKESVVGVEVFGRVAGYDPKIDPVVRVEARRLRLKLQEYYAGIGSADRIRILLPKGTYQPQFELAAAPVSEPATPSPPEPSKWRSPVLVLAGAALAVSLGVWLGSHSNPRSAVATGTPRLLTGHRGFSRSPAFSPDGNSIAFSRNLNVRSSNIYIQSVGGGDAQALTNGPHFDLEPAWSPDGRTIAFLRQDQERFTIMICSAYAACQERRVADVAVRGPVNWTADGQSLVASDRDGGSPAALFLIDIGDGRKRRLTSPPKGTPGDTLPAIGPDGKSVAFIRSAEASVQDVHTVSITGGEVRRLTQENRVVEGAAWHPDQPQPVASMQRGAEMRSLWRVFLNGQPMERIAEAGLGPLTPSLARHGQKLAFVTRLADTNVWRAELTAKGVTRAGAITSSIGLDTGPELSPDGRLVAWRSTSGGTNEVWIAHPDGQQARQLTKMNGPTTGSAHWSPDGKWIVFDSRPKGNGDIFLISVAGGSPRPLTEGSSNEVLPCFSHDGKWIYFSTDRAGLWEVWRMNMDGKEAARIAGKGAFHATESPDGKWLYYTRQGVAESGVWRLPVTGGDEEQLTAEVSANFWGQWAVSSHALFYAVFPPTGSRRAIRRLDLATGAVRDVMTLQKMPVQFDSGMTVSADEKLLLWSQLDQAGSDVFVVDGFR